MTELSWSREGIRIHKATREQQNQNTPRLAAILLNTEELERKVEPTHNFKPLNHFRCSRTGNVAAAQQGMEAVLPCCNAGAVPVRIPGQLIMKPSNLIIVSKIFFGIRAMIIPSFIIRLYHTRQ